MWRTSQLRLCRFVTVTKRYLRRWCVRAPQPQGQRARIVLLASRGVANALISELVGVSRPTVNLWRGRYLEHGLEGLVDIPRPGRPKVVDDAAIITATPRPSPKRLGVTHWSSRLLAPRLGVYQVHGHQGLEEVQGSGHGRPTCSRFPPTRNWRPRSPTL